MVFDRIVSSANERHSDQTYMRQTYINEHNFVENGVCSDLPGSNFAISVQRFPYFRCAIDIALSSASVQGSFRMEGSN